MTTGELISCTSDQAWKNYKNSGKPLVVFFSASWYLPSALSFPEVADLARDYTNITFIKVDVDRVKSAVKELNGKHHTFVIINKGTQQMIEGADVHG